MYIQNYGHYTNLVIAISLWRKDLKVFWKLYIDVQFYANHEYAIYFILNWILLKLLHFQLPPKCTTIPVHSHKGIGNKNAWIIALWNKTNIRCYRYVPGNNWTTHIMKLVPCTMLSTIPCYIIGYGIRYVLTVRFDKVIKPSLTQGTVSWSSFPFIHQFVRWAVYEFPCNYLLFHLGSMEVRISEVNYFWSR